MRGVVAQCMLMRVLPTAPRRTRNVQVTSALTLAALEHALRMLIGGTDALFFFFTTLTLDSWW